MRPITMVSMAIRMAYDRSAQPVAEAHVGGAERKEGDRRERKQDVLHAGSVPRQPLRA